MVVYFQSADQEPGLLFDSTLDLTTTCKFRPLERSAHPPPVKHVETAVQVWTLEGPSFTLFTFVSRKLNRFNSTSNITSSYELMKLTRHLEYEKYEDSNV